VGLVLALDATVLVKPEFRKHVQPYGQPPLEELFQFCAGPPDPGLRLRCLSPDPGVLDEDLKRVSRAQKIDVKRYAQLLVEYDRSVSF
jgi:hypothetical protein